MTVDSKRLIKFQYIRFYLMTIIILSIGSILALYQIWELQAKEVNSELKTSANVAINMLENKILVASRAVDVGVNQMSGTMQQGLISDKTSYDVLKATMENYNFQDKKNDFGLLFYIDRNGIIRAQNTLYPAAHIDVSERLYFRELITDLKKNYSIGSLVVGRTNKKITFHFAEPLINDGVTFNGLLSVQIDADRLATILDSVIKNDDITIYIQASPGHVIFAYPQALISYFITPSDNKFIKSGQLNKNASPNEIVSYFSGVKASAYDYVGEARSNNFGLTAYSRVYYKNFLYEFLQRQLIIIIYILVSALLLSYAFYAFYENAIDLSSSNYFAEHDVLTGLLNRRNLDERLPLLWRNSMREKSPISALFIDIDYFKIFNDTYGHEHGDMVLKEIANTIQKCIERPLDICCRWGGEEFVVILTNTKESGAIFLANKIINSVKSINFNFPGNKRPILTVSIGVASTYVTKKNKTDDLVDMADKAMYVAKQNGRDRYAVYKLETSVNNGVNFSPIQ